MNNEPASAPDELPRVKGSRVVEFDHGRRAEVTLSGNPVKPFVLLQMPGGPHQQDRIQRYSFDVDYALKLGEALVELAILGKEITRV